MSICSCVVSWFTDIIINTLVPFMSYIFMYFLHGCLSCLKMSIGAALYIPFAACEITGQYICLLGEKAWFVFREVKQRIDLQYKSTGLYFCGEQISYSLRSKKKESLYLAAEEGKSSTLGKIQLFKDLMKSPFVVLRYIVVTLSKNKRVKYVKRKAAIFMSTLRAFFDRVHAIGVPVAVFIFGFIGVSRFIRQFSGRSKDEDREERKDEKERINELQVDLAKLAEQHQKVCQLLDQEQMHNRSLAQRNNELTTKLSAEMGKKVAADESSVENVNIKNRPMNIADEYIHFCSNEWLAAKTVLDEVELDDLQEVEKVQLLFQILMISEEEMKKLNVLLLSEIKRKLNNPCDVLQAPAEFHTENEYRPNEKTQPETSGSLPLQVTNSLGDFLRTKADEVVLNKMIPTMVRQVDNEIPQSKYTPVLCKLWTAVKQREEVIEYISSGLRLCWKMAIQRPPMVFRTSDKYLGDKFQELYWKSEDPKTEHPTKLCHVFPMLYHGQSLMVKGKVYLMRT